MSIRLNPWPIPIASVLGMGLLLSFGWSILNAQRPVRLSALQTRTSMASRSNSNGLQPVVLFPVKQDVSPPLRSMRPVPPRSRLDEDRVRSIEILPKALNTVLPQTPDAVVQRRTVLPATPPPQMTFEGLTNVDNFETIGFRVLPPDMNGDIGPSHYVQMVNLVTAVYDRNGTRIFGPVPNNIFWQGFGGPCEFDNDGDPIVLYDSLADRWLVSQFTFEGGPPFFECVAISTSGDPTGAYFRYAFEWPGGKFPDYPKFGVWPDAYYMSVNQFAVTAGGFSFAGAGVAALERDRMLKGDPGARMVVFDLSTVDIRFGGMLPADLDGTNLPPRGMPGFFAEVDDETWIPPIDALRLWTFRVDWRDPSRSTFGQDGWPDFILPTAPWEPIPCFRVLNCILQQAPQVPLDALGDRLMYRLQYRRQGSRQSLVTNHTVWVDGKRTGVRWYHVVLSESRDRECGGTPPCIWRQATQAPDDGLSRWMGSAALDGADHLCVGYSTSSAFTFPDIRYACWSGGGTTYDGEQVLFLGGGSQTHDSGRWGDYSMLTVDPRDDCTFWYTQEYYRVTNEACPETSSRACWHTRVGTFRYPDCGRSR